jgi:hypothetical protein
VEGRSVGPAKAPFKHSFRQPPARRHRRGNGATTDRTDPTVCARPPPLWLLSGELHLPPPPQATPTPHALVEAARSGALDGAGGRQAAHPPTLHLSHLSHFPTFSLRRRRPTFPLPLRTKRQDAASTPGPRCPFRRRRLLKQRAPGPSPEQAGGRRPTFPPPNLPTFPLSHFPTFSLRRRRPTFPLPLRTKRQDAASTPGPRCPFRRRRLLKQRAPGPSPEQAGGRRPTFPPSHLPTFPLSHFLTPPQAAQLPTCFTHKAAGCRFYARTPLPFSPQALAEAARSGALAGAGWGQAAHLPTSQPSHFPTFPLSHSAAGGPPSHFLYAQSGRMPLLRQDPAALFAAGAC